MIFISKTFFFCFVIQVTFFYFRFLSERVFYHRKCCYGYKVNILFLYCCVHRANIFPFLHKRKRPISSFPAGANISCLGICLFLANISLPKCLNKHSVSRCLAGANILYPFAKMLEQTVFLFTTLDHTSYYQLPQQCNHGGQGGFIGFVSVLDLLLNLTTHFWYMAFLHKYLNFHPNTVWIQIVSWSQ